MCSESVKDTATIKSWAASYVPSRITSSTDSLSTPSASSSKRGRMTGAIALTTIGHGITDLNASYCKGLEQEEARHQYRMSQQDHRDNVMSLAMERAQELDSDLSPEDLIALFEVFQTEEGSAKAYILIKIETVRKAWVKHKVTCCQQAT